MKKRAFYIVLFVILVFIEVMIALFINDSFIRPYLGDVIVVWAVYCFAQIFLAERMNKYFVCTGVFVFAVIVEFLQGINIVKILGLEQSSFFSTLIGTHFDLKDILCYAVGSAFLALIIFIQKLLFFLLKKEK